MAWEPLKQSSEGVLVIKTLRTLDLQAKFIAFRITCRRDPYNCTKFFQVFFGPAL